MAANRLTNTVTVLRNEPARPGTFVSRIDVGAGLGSRTVDLGDFNGDGKIDLAIGNEYMAKTTILSNTTVIAASGFAFSRMSVANASSSDSRFSILPPVDVNHEGRFNTGKRRRACRIGVRPPGRRPASDAAGHGWRPSAGGR